MEHEEYESHCIDSGRYCIADEMIEAGTHNGKQVYQPCGGSDPLAVYENVPLGEGETSYSAYCFSCSQNFPAKVFHTSSHATDFGIEGGIVTDKKVFKRLPKKEVITKEEIREVLSYGYEGNGYRGLKDSYLQYFGHAVKKDSKGNPKVIFYPETRAGKLTGYKSRTLPKSFGYENKGLTGIKSDLAGMVKFKDMVGRDILIVGGECCMVSAFQMFDEYQKDRAKKASKKFGGDQGEYLPMPVVSPTTGEGSAVNQCRDHYDYINSFDNILIGMDADEAGRSAAKAIASIFPKSKVKIISWTMGDCNSYLHNKEGKDYSPQFIRDFYNAKPFSNDGIITSKQADDSVEAELLRPKIALPSFMSGLQKKMAGGIPLGYAVNWIAESGIGKSTLVNEAIRHFIYNSPYKIGILSLELTAPQYMISMISREVGRKINLFESPEEAVEFIRRPEVVEARNNLSMNEYGESRFAILDERDGDLDEVKVQCELLINKHGCQVLVIDPIQDLFEGVSMDSQNSFIKWMKNILKKGVTFINVCHVRKGNNSTDKDGKRILRELSEDDVMGISGIVKSAGANIFMSRNKYADNSIEQNTTFPTLGKCRWSGNTGRLPPWYYDNASHTMYDLVTYFNDHPEDLGSYDLDYNPFYKDKSNNSKQSPKKDLPVDNFNIDIGNGVVL